MQRLAALGYDAVPAAPLVIAALRDPEPALRVKAAQMLRMFGPAARPCIPDVTALLKDPESSVRDAAAETLAGAGDMAEPSIPALVQSLRAGPERRCLKAALALASIGEPAVPALIALLKEPDVEIRKAAVGSLSELAVWQDSWRPSPTPTRLAPILEALARDPDVGVRVAMGNMLVATQSDFQVILAPLRILLRDPNAEVRRSVTTAFSLSNATIPAALRPAILELLKDREPSVRVAVAASIPQQDLAAPAIIDGLLGALKDSDADVRAAASQKLSEARYSYFGTTAEGGDCQWMYTSAALTQNPNAYAALKSATADRDSRVRAAAASLMPVFKSEAATSIPMLIDRLKDPAENVRAASVAALAGFGPSVPRGATRALLALLADRSELQVGDATISTHAARRLRPSAAMPKPRCSASWSTSSTHSTRPSGNAPVRP